MCEARRGRPEADPSRSIISLQTRRGLDASRVRPGLPAFFQKLARGVSSVLARHDLGGSLAPGRALSPDPRLPLLSNRLRLRRGLQPMVL